MRRLFLTLGNRMGITNPLEKLALEYWYHVVMAVSIVIFLLAGSGVLKAFPVAPVSLISLGSFFVGLGEWVNHPLQTSLRPADAYFPGGVITGHPRNNKPVGILFVILGVVLIGFGIFKFIAT